MFDLNGSAHPSPNASCASYFIYRSYWILPLHFIWQLKNHFERTHNLWLPLVNKSYSVCWQVQSRKMMAASFQAYSSIRGRNGFWFRGDDACARYFSVISRWEPPAHGRAGNKWRTNLVATDNQYSDSSLRGKFINMFNRIRRLLSRRQDPLSVRRRVSSNGVHSDIRPFYGLDFGGVRKFGKVENFTSFDSAKVFQCRIGKSPLPSARNFAK